MLEMHVIKIPLIYAFLRWTRMKISTININLKAHMMALVTRESQPLTHAHRRARWG